MLLGPSRADLIKILVESFTDPVKLRGFVQTHLTSPVSYEAIGLTPKENAGNLIDELDSMGLLDTFLKELQKEFQDDVPLRSARFAQILREYYAGPPASKLYKATQRLNTREVMYALLTGLSALAMLHPSLQALLTRLANTPLPVEMFYAAAALLGLLTLAMIWKVFRRRSRLLRPEKFIIRPEDPHCFIGREREVEDLWHLCDQRSLVMLLGESGSGKSTLARFGLQSRFRTTGGPTPRWHSIMIDGAAITKWEGGIGTELARQLINLPMDVRQNLGAERPPLVDDIFGWIESWPKTAATRLLITFDQLDDYFEAFRSCLMQGSRLLSPDELLNCNADWKRLAQLSQDDRIHLLLICRSDSMAPHIFRIAEPSNIPLQRIDSDLVAPLLVRITEPDGEGHVIENPDAGWTMLAPSLTEDLGRAGGVLPVQLVITLDALAKIPFLDSREYSTDGGLAGLGRHYVHGRINEAVHLGGATSTDLLRGLVALTTRDGSKTVPLTPEQFHAEVFETKPADPKLDDVIKHLCGHRILRKRESTDGQVLQLYHDFLAKPVREMFRLANAETDLLETHVREFNQATDVLGHWRSLLSMKEQLQIFRAKCRGRLLYGQGAGLAHWSLTRSLTIAMSMLLFGMIAADQVSKQADYSRAVQLLGEIGILDIGDPNQVESIHVLSRASLTVRLCTFEMGLSEKHIDKFIFALPLFLHTTLGLADDPKPFAVAIVKQMTTEHSSRGLSRLGKALGSLSPKLEPKDVQPGAVVIVEQMNTETNSSSLQELGEALGSLCTKLEPRVVQLFAAAIVKRMETETELSSESLSGLGKALGTLSPKLESKDVQPGAVAIVKRMETDMETEMYSSTLQELGEALGSLSPKLEPKDVQPGAVAIVKRMKTEIGSQSLSRLGKALGSLCAKLEPKDVQPGAVAIVMRMKTETDSDFLRQLSEALGSLSPKLEPKDVQPGAVAIVKQMETEFESSSLQELGEALGSLSPKLEPKDVKPFAVAIVMRMETEANSDCLRELSKPLRSLSLKLEPKDVQLFAAAIMKRMETESDSYYRFSCLGAALGSLSPGLEPKDVQLGAAAIMKRMETEIEIDSDSLSRLGEALGSMSPKLEPKDVQLFAVAIVKQMETELSSPGLSRLGKALGSLSPKLEPKDVQPGAVAILKLMETEMHSSFLQELGEALGSLSPKLERAEQLHLLELLKSPQIVEVVRDTLLKNFDESGVFDEKLYEGEEQNLSIWRYVDWAKDPERGGKYGIDLRRSSAGANLLAP